MIIQVEPIHLFWFAIIGLSLVGAAAAVGRWLISQAQQKTDAQVTLLLEDSRKWSVVETQLLELRVELPERYVRREDYIRGQAVVEAKLDALAGKVDVLRIQGASQRGELT
jgi:hypothetical protein